MDKMDAELEEARKNLKEIRKKIAGVSHDRETLHAYQMREMALLDFISAMNNAFRKGEQRGIAIGKQRAEQRRIAMIISKMNRKGFSVEKISDCMDIPVEEVVKILKEQTI
ncbi:MAG: hypothetical protein LBR08_09700 [Bacteroidales bacterium]|jgi:predicted transposase/invertase (TIGR01784 family)|nr:hypothetical protein [Bacteroidales bacterium]